MLMRGLFAFILVGGLLNGAAWAQEPKKPVDPVVEEVGQSFSQEGIQARQLRAIKALADAYEREKARADAAEAKLTQPR
jgi:hypothetical protein